MYRPIYLAWPQTSDNTVCNNSIFMYLYLKYVKNK